MRPGESFVEQPVRSLQTMLRVIAEDDSRLPTVIPDGIYGPTTMQAVSAFQRQYELPVTGITDQATYIYLLQSILIQLANDNPSISPPDHNGILDDPTSQALAAFQLLAALPPTGELDKITWKYLTKHFTLSANRHANNLI